MLIVSYVKLKFVSGISSTKSPVLLYVFFVYESFQISNRVGSVFRIRLLDVDTGVLSTLVLD